VFARNALPLMLALVLVCGAVLLLTPTTGLAGKAPASATPSYWAFLPLFRHDFVPSATPTPTPTRTPTPTPTATYACPSSSNNQYTAGTAYQYDLDDPVRRAWNNADKNIAMRSYTLNTDPGLRRELIDYGADDPIAPPQFATLFSPYRVPPFAGFYRVYDWIWLPSPDPGYRGNPLTTWPVTAMGLRTTPGEVLHTPWSGYDLGGGMKVIVLYADADSVTLRYTREDSSAPPGYLIHVDRICTDPSLLALYRQTDRDPGPRYIYVPPAQRPYTYNLPNMPAGQPFGTARGTEVVIAVTDTGSFMDTRSCNEWWRIRPGYTGTCLPP
jgi:hypothetical protein